MLKMRMKKSPELFIFGIGTLCIMILMFIIFLALHNPNNTPKQPIDTVPIKIASVVPQQQSSTLPIKIIIPKIHVRALFEYVGLTKEGAIDIPKDPANAAWFESSPLPGEKGNAIIVGHYGWKNNVPAVFDDLQNLTAGDVVYIEKEDATMIVFIVQKIETYKETDNTSSLFRISDAESHLNLITCGGVWNKIKKSYSDRLVVFANRK